MPSFELPVVTGDARETAAKVYARALDLTDQRLPIAASTLVAYAEQEFFLRGGDRSEFRESLQSAADAVREIEIGVETL